ncbi:phage holin [Terribacillus sp. 179-K 1B1 HS]|uniref:phage holin n=1 Tax=Terribacillus sp. 179-K 1B1 HS TaxID=3142388 RepID=UPI00399F67BC
MKFDWKARLKNPTFYVTMVPALLLVAQVVLAWFGVDVAWDLIQAEAMKFINAVFAVLTILGIVANPKNPGINDNEGDEL